MKHLKLVFVTAVLTVGPQVVAAQDTVRWSGLFYMDYEYLISSSNEAEEGDNGFDYRRMYLTADYTLSDEFSGRARVAATDQPANSHPFVKDLYLKWKGAIGEGHDLVFGVQSPPVYTLSEKIWGYRSLEKTIMDRQEIASSRDMGVAASGRLTSDGRATYAVMVANNNGVLGEDDKYKRVYGQFAWQSKRIAASVGGDFAAGDDRNAINTNAFASYTSGRVRVGAEGYFQRIDFDHSEVSTDKAGISVWIVTTVNDKVELVGRTDYVEIDDGVRSTNETFLIGGVSFSPNRKVHFIPNVYVVDSSGRGDPEIAGRITLHADF